MSGGLFDPLGTDRGEPTGPWSKPPSAAVVAAALAVGALAALLALSWLRDDGDRGRPVAVAPIEHLAAPPKQPVAPAAAPALATAPPPAAAPGQPPRDDQEVEVQNGVRIVRPRRDAQHFGGQTVTVPGPALAPAR